jgi:hypothetical protein
MTRIQRLLHGVVVIGAALAVTMWYAVTRGQDVNWDQLNYHIGVPLLLSRGTFWDSIAPAGIQSYFNPYLLRFEFLLIRMLPPVGAAAGFALMQSASFMMAGVICAAISWPAGGWRAVALGLLGFALCLMAPIALSEAGTTMTDLTLTALVLAAYALLLTRGQRIGLIASGAAAGMLLGVATALKLTNAVFAVGAVGFAFAGREPFRQRIGWLLAYGATAAVGFLAVGGAWHWELWSRFGNPFFPYYNNIFHSPDYPATELRDMRFLPHSVWDIWRYPYYWSFAVSPSPDWASATAEMRFRDQRWIVVAPGVTLFLAALLVFRQWARARLIDPATGLLFAFTIDYLVWLEEFSLHRYVLPVEILCGAIVLIFAMLVRPYLLGIGLLTACSLLIWPKLLVTNWGHLPWRPYWQTIASRPLDLGPSAIVFLAEKPMFFVAASLPADARFVGAAGDIDLRLNADMRLTRQLKQELDASPNARLVVVDHGTMPEATGAILDSYGLTATGRCQSLAIAIQTLR